MSPTQPRLTTLLSSAHPTTVQNQKKKKRQEKKAFLFSAVLVLNVSHTINPPNAADPQTAALTQLEEEPGTAWPQLTGMSSCPFASEAICTQPWALHWVFPHLWPPVPRPMLRHQPCHLVCGTGGGNSSQRDPPRLRFPRGPASEGLLWLMSMKGLPRGMTWQPLPLPSRHRAGL